MSIPAISNNNSNTKYEESNNSNTKYEDSNEDLQGQQQKWQNRKF